MIDALVVVADLSDSDLPGRIVAALEQPRSTVSVLHHTGLQLSLPDGVRRIEVGSASTDGALFDVVSGAVASCAAGLVVVGRASPTALAAVLATCQRDRRAVQVCGAPDRPSIDEPCASAVARLVDAVVVADADAATACIGRGVPPARLHVALPGTSAFAAAVLGHEVRSVEFAGLPSDGDRTGRDLGDAELGLVTEAIRSGTLNSTRGTFVTRFERAFAERIGTRHAIACASGSAAVHCAIAALGLDPGDEVITTPITDMGAITPIVYEGGMPVFADVDATTMNVTAATIAERITARTRGIVATHLFGLPCDMRPIRALADRHRLPLIEDAAQAFLATDAAGGLAGTLGRVGCFSLQQGKHMTTGEGGIVTTDDDGIARHTTLFVNKAWGYGDPQPDHYFPALNYRMTELQGAVALAQLEKLDSVVERRRAVARRLSGLLRDVPGLDLPPLEPNTGHAFWKYPILVDPERVDGGVIALAARLRQRGVACAPRYIQKPAFECKLFADWNAHAILRLVSSREARGDAPLPTTRREDFPGAYSALSRVLVLPVNERYTDDDVTRVADAIRAGVASLACSH